MAARTTQSLVSRLRDGRSGFRNLKEREIFLEHPDRLRYAIVILFNGSFLGVERPGPEADRSLPSGVNVKNEYIFTSMQYIRTFVTWTQKALLFNKNRMKY
jgi:hypothetical protein